MRFAAAMIGILSLTTHNTMDFETLSGMIREQRAKYHLTLGQLIAVLEQEAPLTLVYFDTGGAPHHPHSYRGYYADLAIESVEDKQVRADDLLAELKGVLNIELGGWKGGDYLMDEDTPLWCADHGHTGRAIVSISHMPGSSALILATKEIE